MAEEVRHGHPRFYELMESFMDLHSRKNKDYAKEGNPLGNFNRVAAIEALYPDFNWATPFGVTVQYMLKQLDAAMHLYEKGEVGGVENVGTRLGDVSVYSTIGVINWEEEQASRVVTPQDIWKRGAIFRLDEPETEEEIEPIPVPCPRDCVCGPPGAYCPLGPNAVPPLVGRCKVDTTPEHCSMWRLNRSCSDCPYHGTDAPDSGVLAR